MKKPPKSTAETSDGLQRQSDDPANPAVAATAEASPPAASAVEPKAALQSELRRAHAREAVERFATYSAVGGLLPLPFFDALSVTTTIVVMIQRVAGIYGERLKRDRARAFVAAFAAGMGLSGVGSATAVALAKWLPGANFVGGMISSATAAALTRTIGRAFILHFETGGTALQFSAESIRAHFATLSESQPSSRR